MLKDNSFRTHEWMDGWMDESAQWRTDSSRLTDKQPTLGRMSFSFFSTKRPSRSSLFQFSCTTSGFSSRSSWRSSKNTDTAVRPRVHHVVVLILLTLKPGTLSPPACGTHRRWRGPHTASTLARTASSCQVGTSPPASQWRPALSLCWTPGCTWWQSYRQRDPGSRTASRRGTPSPVQEIFYKRLTGEQKSILQRVCSGLHAYNTCWQKIILFKPTDLNAPWWLL